MLKRRRTKDGGTDKFQTRAFLRSYSYFIAYDKNGAIGVTNCKIGVIGYKIAKKVSLSTHKISAKTAKKKLGHLGNLNQLTIGSNWMIEFEKSHYFSRRTQIPPNFGNKKGVIG